ncbi:MAG: hypothetical protein JWR26_3090, partial [Pedosphaera sp.]|nr:hypothetical protein [Pedosphaera sp.]
MGPSTALRRSRRVPRAGRALCRGKRSSAKRVPVCGPAAQNQDLRDRVLACYDGHHGGEERLPRFVPLWPALLHRAFFFGGMENRVPPYRGCLRMGHWGPPSLRSPACGTGAWQRKTECHQSGGCVARLAWGLAWTMDEVGLLRLPAVAQKLWRALCKKGSIKVCKAGTGGEGPNGRPGLENDPPRPGVFLFFC